MLTVIPYLVAIAAVARASVEEPAHPDTKKDLFRGDFVAAFDHEMHSIDKFYGHVHGKKEVARLIPPYMLLRLAQLTESWAVTIVPWVLQAAATGGTQEGKLDEMMEECDEFGLDALIAQARATGHVRRVDMVAAVQRCKDAQGLAGRAMNGLEDDYELRGEGSPGSLSNRYHWTALHFAASAGNLAAVEDFVTERGAAVDAQNGLNQTALHLAVARLLKVHVVVACDREIAPSDRSCSNVLCDSILFCARPRGTSRS